MIAPIYPFNWYFLNYWEFQVGGDKPFDFQLQVAIVKAW
jgi:hypothetical protein